MCGLVGCAGKVLAAHEKAFKTLLILNSLRGEDSTGVAGVSDSNEVLIHKEIGNPFDLMQDKRFDKIINRMNKVLIGHGRFATTGKVNKTNAHPFEFDTLVGVHNGTLKNKGALDRGHLFDVDSQALYDHIDRKGVKSAIESVEGAWALVWWEKQNHVLNLLRNKERPLFTCLTKDDVIFWASEDWMLKVALGRHDIKAGEPEPLPEDHIYSFHFNKREMVIPDVIEQKGKEIVVQQNFSKGNWERQQQLRKQELHRGTMSSTGAANNVLQLPNNQGGEVGPKKQLLKFPENVKAEYCKVKNRMFEILALNANPFGAAYLVCFDPIRPNLPIRLYTNKSDDYADHVGGEIIADISGVVDCKVDGEYFKILHSSVKIVKKPEKEELFITHNGKLVGKKEWSDRYPNCSWCQAPLFPEDANHLATSGDCLCPDCGKDTEVTQYLKLI